MLKIKALNRESSSDEDTPVIRREAQEEIALELYNKALHLQAQEVFSQAESILLKLIDENIPLLENNGGLPKSMSNLKYSCHVNIGNIYLKLNRINDALERYLLASELDATDVTLWYKIGNLSIDESKFHQSAYAFAKGLECSESHWPCLDKLISVLFAIKDTIACLEYIGKALILDPNYTKGLVLRQQIYRDNPASKEYYKLYNPESIWEPPLEVEITEEDEKTYLDEVQNLISKVNEAEKALAPKPLETIALPKPLVDYTWLCLTEVIVYIHQYISDQGMSHFTMFDMSKSMSNKEEPAFKFPQTDSECTKPVENKVPDVKNPVNGQASANEKLLNEQIIERRLSQNSDNVIDNQENTSMQTDNDDDQTLEPDTEDQDETAEQKEKGRPRTKRKRDLLSDLQTWGWYSRRKLSKKAKEKDFTIEDAFERIIPKKLLPHRIDPEKFVGYDDSMNTMDLYNLYMDNCNINYLSPIHSPTSVNYEQYFGTEKERDDVEEFWTKTRESVDAVVLIKELVFRLSKLWHYKWPKELVPLYVKAYNMFREHYDPPQVFCGGHSFEELRDDALASLLFCELVIFSCEEKVNIPPMLIGYMRLISGWKEKWNQDYPSFFIRLFWLESHLFRKEKNNDLAINSLHLIKEAIEEEESNSKEKYMLSLPNCFKYGLVNGGIICKILKHLDIISSLSLVENMYNSEKYREVADILKATFNGGPCLQVGRLGRPAQLGILMHSLWYLNKTECFIWTEECLNEAFDQYLKLNKDQDKWEKILEKCLAILYEIIKSDTICIIDHLHENNRARIVQNLAKTISKQLNSEVSKNSVICVKPWILLHFVLLREEQREYAKKRISKGKKADVSNENEDPSDNSLPPSIEILFSAHEFLGSKGWCMSNQGELLHFIIDTILDKLDTPIFERMRDKIDIHIEQSMFCLYQHPSKKNKISRHLADHNVDPIPLSWERASQVYEFYGPDSLPEFNSYKNASISSDLEQLFKRIIALVPTNNSPQQYLPKIMDYIHGKTDVVMEPVPFPRKVKSIYYLIGDFYFKQREFNKCIKYFQLDLCINPGRLDSWACLGLSYAAQLDTKLNHCEKFKNEMEFLEKAKYATICFKKSLEICPDPLMLWIEYGTFQYTAHSYCSRILKYESENLSMEKFEFLENQKNSYLDSSGSSFEKAIALYEAEETNEADERWLQYYILGKIAEKKQKEPTEYLQYYITASTLLEENNAEYPEKINYNNPQHLSVEALELHYRIHASVLKYLELHEGKEIPNTLGAFFKKCLSSSNHLKKAVPQPPPAVETATSAGSQETKVLQTPVAPVPVAPVALSGQLSNACNKSETNDGNHVSEKENLPSTNDKKADNLPEPAPIQPKTQKPTYDIEDVIVLSDSDEDVKVVESAPDIKQNDKICENGKTDTPQIEKTVEPMETDIDEGTTHKISKSLGELEKMEVDNSEPTDKIKELVDSEGTLHNASAATTNNKIENISNEPEQALKTTNSNLDNPEASNTKPKDVQTLLDEMMMQTMKNSDEPEPDSDLSGAEKFEEVIVQQENEVNDVKKDESSKSPSVKTVTNDVEMDTNNKPVTSRESSSGSSSSSSSESSDSDSDDDDSSSSSSSSSSDKSNEFMSHSDLSHLIDRCILGLEICVVRLTQNYKALYRLAHIFFNYKAKKDLSKCKQLLMSEYKCKDGTVISGLFSDRKPINFFNGIWRIPSSEIDRPGSLSAHMSRCLSLLLQILRTTNDTKTLIDLCVNLRKTPEPDKIYIKDSERIAFADQAMTMCIQSIRDQIKHIPSMTNPQIAKLLQEIYKIYQRLQKHAPGKEIHFANLLEEVYKKFIKEKIPDNVNVLDLAVKFCSQNRAAEKQKLLSTPKPQILTPRGSPITSVAPVMPSPQVFTPQSLALKRPGSQRPRGRPPLQKPAGQQRYQRSKNPASGASKATSFPWQKPLLDHSYAYEYLKHYQDELIKQYSQNLSIAQLTQLSSILTQGHINNPLAASAVTSQMFAQTNLLNTNLLQNINPAGSSVPTSASSQLMDNLNQLNPAMKKKLGVDQALSNLTPDQLKVLGTLIPKQQSSTFSNKLSSSHAALPIPSSVAGNSTKQQSQRSAVPSASKSIVDQSKNKMGVPASLINSMSMNLQTGSQLFREPAKKVPLSAQDDKSAKDLMKDRPNISITPVSLSPTPSVSPNFMRPTSTSPSSGKTLQEKLAEKKKEQQNKQLKSTHEGEKRQAELYKKNLNLPNIPSSLTVSPVTAAQSGYPSTSDVKASMFAHPKSSNKSSKFSLEYGLPMGGPLKLPNESMLAPPLNVSKAITSHLANTPTFSLDSGVSISQVSVNQKKKGKSVLSTDKKQIDPVVLMPINKKANASIKQYQKNPQISKKPAKQSSSSKISSESQKKLVDFSKIKSTAQKAEATPSSTSRTHKVVRIQANPAEITLTKSLEPLSRGEISIEAIPKKKSNTQAESAQDDVICID
ncbi:unnamed protein product [Phyllotreta striolata]|uniref:Calcineurin-binding protein cabin-1 n=1 Tax=Phyllotreta striolata TaxID=444603 RepID=A0A9N9TNW7_PHYSR|nr:unnamed protein product [Phyllotreta striolata]